MRVVSSTSTYPHTITIVWNIQALSPGARTLLDVSSFTDPAQIREQLFTNVYDDHGVLHSPRGQQSFRKARTELLRLPLVQLNTEGLDLANHRMIQNAANALFSFTIFII